MLLIRVNYENILRFQVIFGIVTYQTSLAVKHKNKMVNRMDMIMGIESIFCEDIIIAYRNEYVWFILFDRVKQQSHKLII